MLEISQVRRGLVLPRWHQEAVGAEEITLSANDDDRIVRAAIWLGPIRTWVRVTTKCLVHAPRPRQGVIEHGDFDMKNARITLVDIKPFLEG
jgi:hypothetical protein